MLNIREYRNRPQRLADFLPWAALVAPGIVLNKDGSFQRTVRYRGPDLESADAGELVSFCARVNNVLKRFGAGWALFFEADRIPAGDYAQSEWRDPVAWLVDEERRASFEGGAHFESVYYLTFAWLPPSDGAAKTESMFFERSEREEKASARDHLERFLLETDRAIDLLSMLTPECAALDDDETLGFLHSCVSSKRHRVAAPSTPIYLDGLLADEALSGGFEPMLGENHLRVIGVNGFPPASEPGFLDALNALGISYRWTTRFIALDKARAEKELVKYRRQWFAKRKSIAAIIKETLFNEQSALVDSDADNKAADADAALQELGADDVAFGYLTTSITVADADRRAVETKAQEIERVLNGRGFVTIRESLNAVDAWLGTLPGHLYANIRQPLIHTLNLAHLAPLSAIWAGEARNAHLDGPPLLSATTCETTPFRLVTHIGDVGHTMIVGPTGAGKSVLLALMALQFRRYEGAQIFAFDKGRSTRATILALGGAFHDLGAEGEISFQPLRWIDSDEEKARAQSWLLGVLEQEGAALDPPAKEAVWSALGNLSEAPEAERTLTGLSLLLQRADLRAALKPFTIEGAHGGLFDAEADSFDLADVVGFEMETLMRREAAVAPALSYLFDRLDDRFEGRPTFLILDEAWLFLDHPLFAERLRDWLKTLRKKNVSVIFATQSLSDIQTSAIAPAIIESCPSRIFLANPRAREAGVRSVYEAFGLNERQIEIIATATPKRDYYYQSSAGNRLFDLGLGPVALGICGASSPADQKLIDRILSEAGLDAFASAFLRAKGLAWAADLLTDNSMQETSKGAQLCAAE
ncbi:conjugal transfer protein TrbE [Hyphococcus luteus]|uniref:Conjugal transfer protein TrbE n=1 Tax=Hyphococcus luteus TaxID=2058213 RepID=A0A2S7K9N6_9PROT|nr:conjugal transfer protein TrbE [Marinicaulis flavus]PQA89234.1 conjugal transfer protein TrbE [Marinicaulis flavus]